MLLLGACRASASVSLTDFSRVPNLLLAGLLMCAKSFYLSEIFYQQIVGKNIIFLMRMLVISFEIR